MSASSETTNPAMPASTRGGGLSTLDTCGFLGPDEVKTGIGASQVSKGVRVDIGASHACRYDLASGTFTVTAVSQDDGTPATYETSFAAIENGTYKGASPVAGVGKKALYRTGQVKDGNTSSITVLLDKAILEVVHVAPGTLATQNQLADVARKVAGRVN